MNDASNYDRLNGTVTRIQCGARAVLLDIRDDSRGSSGALCQLGIIDEPAGRNMSMLIHAGGVEQLISELQKIHVKLTAIAKASPRSTGSTVEHRPGVPRGKVTP